MGVKIIVDMRYLLGLIFVLDINQEGGILMRATNPCGKSRPVDNPYEVWENQHGWTWHVLKKNQLEKNETPTSIWFCAVKSPYTFGSWEYGDCYKKDVVDNAVRVS